MAFSSLSFASTRPIRSVQVRYLVGLLLRCVSPTYAAPTINLWFMLLNCSISITSRGNSRSMTLI